MTIKKIQAREGLPPAKLSASDSVIGQQTCPDGFVQFADGVYQVSGHSNTEQRISGPISVSAFTKDSSSDTFGFALEWTDFRGGMHREAYPMELLHDQSTALAKALAARGLDVVPGKERALARYLGGFREFKQLAVQRATTQLGWQLSSDGRLAYVLPDRALAASGSDLVHFQPESASPTTHTIHASGSLTEWKEQVARYCQGNPYLVFALVTALSAPLLKFARIDCGGFHLYGLSSRGKTTTAQVAASVFGCGADPADAPGQSYVQRWNATVNGLEALSAAHNDGLLVLDEIGSCTARDFGSAIYNLLGGKGKQTLTKDRRLRPARTWQLHVFSTGEVSAQSKIEEQDGQARTGQLVRLIDIPIEGGIFDTTHGYSSEQFARILKLSSGRYYGTAGASFIEGLIRQYGNVERLEGAVQLLLDQHLKAYRLTKLTPERQRVARRFALLETAGELAVNLGVVDLAIDEILTACRQMFRLWSANGDVISDEVRGATNVRNFLQRHSSRLQRLECGIVEGLPVRDCAGYIGQIEGKPMFLLTTEGFREACGGKSHKNTAGVLQKAGLLHSTEPNRYDTKVTVGEHRPRLVAIHERILEHEFGEAGASGYCE